MSNPYRIGDAVVTRITEQLFNEVPPRATLPDWRDEVINADADWLIPRQMTADRRFIMQSVHSWLVRTPHHTILIDTASGNGKPRPFNPPFHQLNTRWLEALADAGVRPEEVDYVFNTHLHVDHVGWNTLWRDGQWQPTFPRAKYVFSRREFEYYGNPDHVRPPSRGVFEDSVQPVVEAGLAEMIEANGEEFLDGLAFHRTPGHSVDHMSITLRSGGETALFGGDVMHHPLQVLHPHWNSVYCEFPEEARASRRWALEFAADRRALFFSSHFPDTSAGRITRRDGGFTWTSL